MHPLQLSQLDAAEQRAFKILQSVQGNSPWPVEIREICREGTAIEFRLLVQQLQEDARDNPAMMKTILGAAYEVIINL